jgi:predicted nucleic acid-binding protein
MLASARRRLLVSTEAVAEAVAVIAHNSGRFPYAPAHAEALIALLEAPSHRLYNALMPEAVVALRHAPASRNGSVKDAHILALAWTFDADIWSHDRDFAGTGWPSWSSANLAAALSTEAGASAAQP